MASVARPYRILCFGDSVTAGYYAKGQKFEPYGKTLCEEINASGSACVISTCGCSGLTAAQLAESLDSPVVKDMLGRLRKGLGRIFEEDGPQDVVVLMVGTNDLGKHLGVEPTLANTKQLQRACQDKGVPIVLLSPPQITRGEIRDNRNHLRKVLEAWASETPWVLACYDCENLVPRSPGLDYWEPEEFHLSATGSMQLGRRLADLLLPLLKQLHPGVSGASIHQEVTPTEASLEAVGLEKFTVGDAIQVWSNTWRAWCSGTVQGVEHIGVDPMVTVILTLPDSKTAMKRLPTSDAGLRLVAVATPSAASLSKSAYKVDDEVEVWNEEASVWCPGQVRRAVDQQVVVALALPDKVLIKVVAAEISAIRLANAAPATEAQEPSPSEAPLRPRARSNAAPLGSDLSSRVEYAEGDEVEVWSNSCCTWCNGVIVIVDGQTIVTELVLPSGELARKPLLLGKGGLRKKHRSTEAGLHDIMPRRDSLLVDYHAELGMSGLDFPADEAEPAVAAPADRGVAPITAGASVAVWSKTNQLWCTGIIHQVQGGTAVVDFALPSGQVCRKELALGDPELVPGTDLPSQPPRKVAGTTCTARVLGTLTPGSPATPGDVLGGLSSHSLPDITGTASMPLISGAVATVGLPRGAGALSNKELTSTSRVAGPSSPACRS